MKVGVLGAGAIGSMLGGLIKRHAPDLDVVLIARGEHGDAMRSQGGVQLQGRWGVVHVPLHVTDDVQALAGSDYVLLTVKAYSTEEAIRTAAEQIGGATVISIQNGVNQPILSRYLPPARLMMGMTATNVAVSAPGTVTMQRNDATVIGPGFADGSREATNAAANLLRQSRLKIVTDPNVVGSQYNKLIFNTLGAASSLSASDFLGDAVLHRAWRREVAIPLQRESLDVLIRSGIRLSRIPGAPDVYRFRRLLHALNWPVLGRTTEFAVRRFFNRKPIRFSLAIDLVRGKRTEVDFINGEIVRLAEDHGLGAPMNAKVVELVHALERRGGFFTRDEVIASLKSAMDPEAGRGHDTAG